VTGDHDSLPLPGSGLAQRRVPFDKMTPGDKYLLVMKGADHMTFNGQPERRRDNRQDEADTIDPYVQAATLAFWDVYLRGDAEARRWLGEGGFGTWLAGHGEFASK